MICEAHPGLFSSPSGFVGPVAWTPTQSYGPSPERNGLRWQAMKIIYNLLKYDRCASKLIAAEVSRRSKANHLKILKGLLEKNIYKWNLFHHAMFDYQMATTLPFKMQYSIQDASANIITTFHDFHGELPADCFSQLLTKLTQKFAFSGHL